VSYPLHVVQVMGCTTHGSCSWGDQMLMSFVLNNEHAARPGCLQPCCGHSMKLMARYTGPLLCIKNLEGLDLGCSCGVTTLAVVYAQYLVSKVATHLSQARCMTFRLRIKSVVLGRSLGS
jgi:hypothetical protein